MKLCFLSRYFAWVGRLKFDADSPRRLARYRPNSPLVAKNQSEREQTLCCKDNYVKAKISTYLPKRKGNISHFAPPNVWMKNRTQERSCFMLWINIIDAHALHFCWVRQSHVTLTNKENVQATSQHQKRPAADLWTGVALCFLEGWIVFN